MKMMEQLKAKKKDNKGFSLVELIIVIAIMAILVGIVGTQVVPYIEKSRKAKDVQVLSGLCTDAMTAFSSNASILDAGTGVTYTLTITPTGVTSATTSTTDTTGAGKLAASFAELNNVTKLEDLKLESKSGKAVTDIVITCKNEKPMITVKTNTTDGSFDDIESN